MRRPLLFPVLAAGFVSWGTAAAFWPSTAALKPAGGAQDFVYFGDARPVLVRVHVEIDGQPLQAVWDDFIRSVFKQLDTDGDAVLTDKEAERVPPGQLLFGDSNALFGALPPPATSALGSNPPDGKVTIAKLASYYRRSGGAPFQFRFGPRQNPNVYDPFGQAVQGDQAEKLNNRLFELLDTNKDGKLSREELAGADRALLAVDADDDEMITLQELLPGLNQSANPKAAVIRRGPPAAPEKNSSFLPLTPGEAALGLVHQLQLRYGPKGKQPADMKLTRKDIGLDQATFDRLDTNRDGALDAAELARFANRPADLELMVRLGKGTSAAARIELVSPNSQPAPLAANLKEKDGVVTLDLGNTRIDFQGDATAGRVPSLGPRVRQFYLMQFRNADTGNKGFLEMKDVQQPQFQFFRNAFKLMDLNGDGKLYEKEVLDYLTTIQDLQARARASCVTLTVADKGHGLFDLIDTNKDGRLSVREMRNAVKLIDQLDRDGDGQISRGEIPRNYQLTLAPGPAISDPVAGRVAFKFAGMPAPRVSAPTTGPLWFRKMDRNRDGDISRREFLGTDEEFRRIDTDGDGLISREEAERADRELRK